MQEKIEQTLGKLLMWGLIFATLSVTPLWSLDPINPIKMFIVFTTGFMGFSVLFVNRKFLTLGRYKLPLILISVFSSWLLVVLFFSGGGIIQQIFGTTGRNTGLLTLLGLSFLFVSSLFVSNLNYLNVFRKTSLIAGLFSLVYGVAQIAGKDPFNWVNSYSPVIGFLGNPNFQSSLLGLLGSIFFVYLLDHRVSHWTKGGYIIYLIFTFVVIRETHSQQGFLIFVIGSFVTLCIYLRQNRRLIIVFLSIGFLSGLLGIFGLFNKGPLARLLFDDSVVFRGDYWFAGWKMTLSNPIFGVGLDNYGDWYRRSRTIEATLRRGPDITSNAAHNVFLDFSSFGGFPLFLIYFFIMVLVIVSAAKVILRTNGYNAGFVSLVAGWVAFQAQSLVSLNQVGLAIWGWVLSGLIVGYEVNTREVRNLGIKNSSKAILRFSQTTGATTLALFIGLLIGIILAIPPYLASVAYRSALESGDPKLIRKAAYIWPTNPTYMVQVAVTLDDNNLEEQGLKVISDATSKFPDNYAVWVALSLMKSASEEQKTKALVQMKRLDPFNPNLK